ncbi:hypothetical protein ES703_86806 [subsurface metagenome]
MVNITEVSVTMVNERCRAAGYKRHQAQCHNENQQLQAE